MTAAAVLAKLEGVREMGVGRWIARCPAHEDRSPSLSVRELDDGRILLHDFAGCETAAVLDAIGLSMSDLFERPLAHRIGPARSRIPARDLLAVLSEETTAVAIIAADFLANRSIDEPTWRRLATAAQRIGAVRDHAR